MGDSPCPFFCSPLSFYPFFYSFLFSLLVGSFAVFVLCSCIRFIFVVVTILLLLLFACGFFMRFTVFH